MTVGERIKIRRKELGLSADDLADKLGVSRSTIFRYESGYIEKLPADALEPIARILNTSVSTLMGWTDDSTEPKSAPAPDDDMLEYLEELRRNPGLRILFDEAKGMSREDLEKFVRMVKVMRGQE